jgi:hypothetical protein
MVGTAFLLMNAFPLLGCVGDVRLHHAGRRIDLQKSSHVVREAYQQPTKGQITASRIGVKLSHRQTA